jgi:predicted regulator of Ras-like GTPase activity (Roadblock/LC7/MglB family)
MPETLDPRGLRVVTPTAEELDGSLARLAALPGVTCAALVDREGFVLASAGDLGADAEAPAAVASWLAEILDGAGDLLGQGGLRTVLLEHAEGAMLVTPVGSRAILAMVSRDPAALGDARHDVAKALPTLGSAR